LNDMNIKSVCGALWTFVDLVRPCFIPCQPEAAARTKYIYVGPVD
jgi:hypothetical protein